MPKRSLVATAALAVAQEAMSEKELQASIVKAAKDLGYLVTFTWHSFHSPAGDCDLRMVLAGRGLMVECKSERGKVTEPQREFLAAWSTVQGCECYVVRPSTLESFYRVLLGQQITEDKETLRP